MSISIRGHRATRVDGRADTLASRDKNTAQDMNAKLAPLVKSMFLETNPIPVKKAMSLLGMCSEELRLPLCEMDDENIKKLKGALQDYGLLKGQPA